jgi:hypothetical protein
MIIGMWNNQWVRPLNRLAMAGTAMISGEKVRYMEQILQMKTATDVGKGNDKLMKWIAPKSEANKMTIRPAR